TSWSRLERRPVGLCVRCPGVQLLELLAEVKKPLRGKSVGDGGHRSLALRFQPGRIRRKRICQSEAGGDLAQAARLNVQVAHGPELTRDPPKLFVQASGGWRQDVAEKANRGAHPPCRHARLVDRPRVVISAGLGGMRAEGRGG